MLRLRSLAFIAAGVVFWTGALLAAVPHVVSYQGLLTDDSGDPVADGSHSVTFSIYDSETGGADLWSSGGQSITTRNGVYGYLLGSNTPFPADLFSSAGERWLALQVESDPEMSPRTRLVSVPYALHAEDAELVRSLVPNAVGTAEIVDGTIIDENVNQETWIQPTLLNDWVDVGPPYSPVGYFKDVNGVVHLRGAVRTPTERERNQVPVFQLPAGYRPQFQEVLNCAAYTLRDGGGFHHTPYRLDVLGDGTIRFQDLLYNYCGDSPDPDCAPVLLDGATFRAAGN